MHRTIELEADFTDAHFQKGYALLHISQFENALLEFNRTLEIDPNFADAHYNMGITLAKLFRFNDAIISFDKTLNLLPGYAPGFSRKDLLCMQSAITRSQLIYLTVHWSWIRIRLKLHSINLSHFMIWAEMKSHLLPASTH